MPTEELIENIRPRGFSAALTPSWPVLVGLAALARALFDRRELLNDPDTYLHIAAGRWMLAHAALPSLDPFSHSMAGAPWVVHEWLSEVILALTYDASGWSGLALLTAACFAASMALMAHALLPRLGTLVTLIVVTLGVALVLPHLLARPHILALPLLVIWSASLIGARDAGGAPPLRVLPLMTLWANLHGSFMFGVALALFAGAEAAFGAESRGRRSTEIRRWGVFTLLAAVAAVITPNGVAGLLLPFHLTQMGVLENSFGEWLSPNFHTFQPLEVWFLGMMFIGFSLGLKLPVSRLLLLLGLIHMALRNERHADLLAMVGPIAVAASLGPALLARLRPTEAPALERTLESAAPPGGKPALLMALGLVLALGISTLVYPLRRSDDRVTPEAALAAATRLGLSGPVLNDEPFGGYLVFRGVPTFIDGRVEMYGESFLRRYLDAVGGDETALIGLLQEYSITWTLLDPQGGVARTLEHLSGWRRVYADAYAVIYARSDALPR